MRRLILARLVSVRGWHMVVRAGPYSYRSSMFPKATSPLWKENWSLVVYDRKVDVAKNLSVGDTSS